MVSNPRSGSVQVRFDTPEGEVWKALLLEEYTKAVQTLLKTGSTEDEYSQARGKANLVKGLLSRGTPAITITH